MRTTGKVQKHETMNNIMKTVDIQNLVEIVGNRYGSDNEKPKKNNLRRFDLKILQKFFKRFLSHLSMVWLVFARSLLSLLAFLSFSSFFLFSLFSSPSFPFFLFFPFLSQSTDASSSSAPRVTAIRSLVIQQFRTEIHEFLNVVEEIMAYHGLFVCLPSFFPFPFFSLTS
jgi:hypothetical protein